MRNRDSTSTCSACASRCAARAAVEAAEVEQNVLEHVELALARRRCPSGTDSLAAVLEQLGPPERWLPDEERPAWRRTMDRLMTGPEDWRLAYLSFGLTTLMIVTLPIGGILLLLPAFLLSRAWVALIEERGETLGAALAGAAADRHRLRLVPASHRRRRGGPDRGGRRRARPALHRNP